MPLVAQFQKITGVPLRAQAPLLAVMFGHGATHWMGTAFYMLLPWIKDDLSLNYLAVGSLVALTHFSSFLANLGSGKWSPSGAPLKQPTSPTSPPSETRLPASSA